MGGLVSSLAFPVPKLPQSFYHDLLKRRDLVWLETKEAKEYPPSTSRHRYDDGGT